ncbi:Glycoside hydrolase [Trema orientale]|uniref:Glycoside hydrolase n=1 Tax=Trema orientale TaxID=63057 RepID=A0A2P5BIN2_TREOI|nr:Glycoside hydrolase [Trema orientale]
MATTNTLKITKKHHKHLNNPFPASSSSLPFIHGSLFFPSKALPSHQIYSIGKDFELSWSSNHGGSFSIFHNSQPTRPIWATIPGRAFVSAAMAETEVEESRGSFLVKDGDVHLVCNHQTVQNIRMINRSEDCLEGQDHDFLSGYSGFELQKNTQFPVLVISGWVFSMNTKKKTGFHENLDFDPKGPTICAKYWVLFEQKSDDQIGFQVKFGEPNIEFQSRPSSDRNGYGRYRGFRRRVGRFRKRKLGFYWSFSRPRKIVMVSSSEEEMEEIKGKEAKELNRVFFTYSSERSERFYGFGEQFSHMDFKGKRVPILVQEQGIGRGDQPITFAANLVSYRAGGDWSTTYAPSPFYMTSKMRSLYLEGYEYSIFDLTKPDKVQIQIHGNSVQGRILHGNSPSELIESFTETIGRPPQLPEWIISGAVVGMQGGTDTVRRVWDELRKYDVPVSAFWLQDWVGQRETIIGSQLWWNWEVDTTRYSGWQELLKDLSTKHIKVMTYCNPCLAPTDDKPNRRRNHFEEAKKLDILVKDKHGEPYMVPNTAFDVGMLDLTHPDTGSWFKQILQEMVDDGVRGWMADFGEGLPVDCTLHSGEDPISAHNRYPELWAQINREFVEEWKSNLVGKEKEDAEEALVFFMRAGFRNSPKWGMLFWEGDQMVSWQTNDGIKSSVVGLLSSGISGYAFNHSDIGGYCAVNFPFIKYRRSEELLLRWMELNAFTTVFRTHEGNKPSCNSQFYSNDRTLSHFARFAKVYKAWKFYRIQLVKEASSKGLPVIRHLFLHYPGDEHVHSLSYHQFLIGTEILVVPVLDKGKNSVKAYFPIGETCSWQHIWTGELFTRQGYEARVEAPIGYPAVFVKSGSSVGETFLENLRELKIL